MGTATTAPRHDGAGYGSDGRGQGWRLVAFSPGVWGALVAVPLRVFVALGLGPFVGALLAQGISPALAGGRLLAAPDAEAQRRSIAGACSIR